MTQSSKHYILHAQQRMLSSIFGLSVCRCVSQSPQARPTAREVHDIIENTLHKRTNSLPLDSVLHDAASTNLDPEPPNSPYQLRPDYRS